MTAAEPLVLYGMGSPNVRKVVIMLEELELPYELRYIAVFKGDQFAPEFLAMNPLAKVPVLVDPRLGEPLAESGAILFWLAERSGAFLPTEGPARYEVMQWLAMQVSFIGPMLGQFSHFKMLPREEPYAFGRYQAQADQAYRLIDDRLKTRDWLAGDAYSVADIATYPWAEYVERHGFDPADYPALVRWRSRIAERPAVARAADRITESFTAPSKQNLKDADNAGLGRFYGWKPTMPDVDFVSVFRR